MMLPSSYKISSHLDIDLEPFASGGSGDVFRGTLDDLEVCIKRVRVYTKPGTKKAARVCFPHRRTLLSPRLMNPTDLLQRGGDVEALETPKRGSPAGCHSLALPANFELDAWWRSAGKCQETETQCGSTGTCRYHSNCVYTTLILLSAI